MKRSSIAISSILMLVILVNIGHVFPVAAATTDPQNQDQKLQEKQQERQQQKEKIQKQMDLILQQLPELVGLQIQHDIVKKLHDQDQKQQG